MQMLNGIQEEIIKESVDEFDIKKITSLILKGVSIPTPILTFDNEPFIFPYTVNLIQGSQGTNKSYFASHIASAFLNVNREPTLLRMGVNDNYTYIYVKKADASRVYGLELEDILSPNHLNFLVYKDTLIEEHVLGIPGDMFMEIND